MSKTNHPSVKMTVDLVSVETPINGWLRRFQCPICGKVKHGFSGKGLTVRGQWFCNGSSVKNKKHDDAEYQS